MKLLRNVSRNILQNITVIIKVIVLQLDLINWFFVSYWLKFESRATSELKGNR